MKTHAIFGKAGEFRRDERGSLIIFTLFILICIVMIAGIGVDLMRAETDRTRLQSTLDRAVLAGASLEQTLDSETVVRDYFKKAGLEQYVTEVKVVPGSNSMTVSASAKMNTPSFFMKMLGVEHIGAPAAGQAEESLQNIEISLVLDVSGSMGWTSSSSGNKKIDDLKDAAKEFVFLMLCNPDDPLNPSTTCTVDPHTVSISIIPYSEQVLVGENLLQYFNVTNEHTESSCVDFQADDFDTTTVALYDSTDPTANLLQRSAELDPWTNYRYWSTSSSFARDNNRSCKPWSSREILPLGDDYPTLQSYIDNLTASGNTSIDLGMKWGAALLDPAIRPAVADMTTPAGGDIITDEFANRPYDFRDRGMQKVIVLMTDGENTSQHYVKDAYRTGPSPFYKNPSNGRLSVYYNYYGTDYWYWPHERNWYTYPYGGGSAQQLSYQEFWHEYNGDAHEEAGYWLPDAFDKWGYTEKNNRLDAICDAAKAQDIEIFTIGFETSSASNAIMKQCASSDSHHFDVDGLDLKSAFTSIAREIHELRLTH